MKQLEDKVIIITGASRGIGRAAAMKFARADCKLALVARSEEELGRLAVEMEVETLVIPCDLSDVNSAETIIERTLSRFGRVDILINNAAIGIYGPAESAALTDLQTVMTVNFWAPVQLMQAVIPVMRKQGGGHIINVSSIIGRRATPWAGGYCASKAALERMVESMRLELIGDNIRLSTLYPGVTQTDFVAHSLGKQQTRRGRVQGAPVEKVAQKLLWVARHSPRDAYVTLFDRLYVTGSLFFPGWADWLLGRYFKVRE